jgi:hypothetical protein
MPYILWVVLIVAGALGLETLVRHALGPGLAPRRDGITLCLVVHDEVDHVEGLVRELVTLAADLAPVVVETMIVDASSADDCWDLLCRIARSYPAITLLRWYPQHPAGGPLDLATTMAVSPWLLVCSTTGSQVCAPVRPWTAQQRGRVLDSERG